MTALAIDKLWNFLQSLSLTANNKRWLAERLIESANEQSVVADNKSDLYKKSFGVWKDDPEADLMEQVIKEGRKNNTPRVIASFDD